MRVKIDKPVVGYGILRKIPSPVGILQKFKSWLESKQRFSNAPSEAILRIQITDIEMRVKVNSPVTCYGTLRKDLDAGASPTFINRLRRKTKKQPVVIEVIDLENGQRLLANQCSWHPVPEWEGKP